MWGGIDQQLYGIGGGRSAIELGRSVKWATISGGLQSGRDGNVSQILRRVKRFAQSHGVHVWFVAHPAKPPRDEAKTFLPTLRDISASANWVNKADLGIVVHRRPDPSATTTEIHIEKYDSSR
jgi:hypothetical protein